MNRCRMLVLTTVFAVLAAFAWQPSPVSAQQDGGATGADATFQKNRMLMRSTNNTARKNAAKRIAARKAAVAQKVKGGAIQ